MAENQVTYADLCNLLRNWDPRRHARNLVLVAFPIADAHRQARRLATDLAAEYLDFDCAFLAELEKDGWADHLNFERKDNRAIGRMVAQDWLARVAAGLTPQRPLVVGNVNLAVSYQLDVAAALYDASAQGLCVITAGGRLQGQTLLIHNVAHQTSAGAPAYQVVMPSTAPTAPRPPQQDRML